MRILGIDPGYDRLGLALAMPLDQSIRVEYATCISPPKKLTLDERFAHIFQECSDLVKQLKPTVAVIETIYFSKNTTTAIHVAEIRGILMAVFFAHNIPIVHYNPSQIKLAVTGSGNADKTAVAKMLKLRVQLPQEKMLDDTLDAIAICLTHCLLSRQ